MGVNFTVNCYCLDAKSFTGLDHPASYLTTVGNKDLIEFLEKEEDKL